MPTLTLDQVLTDAERLPLDDQKILEEHLRKRRIESWRKETAAEAKKAIAAFRSGKLKPQTVDEIMARLPRGK